MNLVPLPAAINLAAVPMAAIASAVLAFLSTVGLADVPGFRASDGSRNSLMRVLLGVLNVAGLTTYAWTQGIVLVPAQLVTLVATVALAVGGGHVVYSLIKAGAGAGAGAGSGRGGNPSPTLAAVAPPTVPPLPSDPKPLPVPAGGVLPVAPAVVSLSTASSGPASSTTTTGASVQAGNTAGGAVA